MQKLIWCNLKYLIIKKYRYCKLSDIFIHYLIITDKRNVIIPKSLFAKGHIVEAHLHRLIDFLKNGTGVHSYSIDKTLNLTQTITYCLKIIMEYKTYYYYTNLRYTHGNRNVQCLEAFIYVFMLCVHICKFVFLQQICNNNWTNTPSPFAIMYCLNITITCK